MALFLRDHIGEEFLDCTPMAENIDVEELLQALGWDIEYGVGISDTSIIDQNGGSPQVRADSLCYLVYLLSRCNVAWVVANKLALI